MSHQFTYVLCNAPETPQAIGRKNQAQASATFQQYKKKMKAENQDTDNPGPHMLEIGVTDDLGKPVNGYTAKCHHSYPY